MQASLMESEGWRRTGGSSKWGMSSGCSHARLLDSECLFLLPQFGSTKIDIRRAGVNLRSLKRKKQ